MGKIDLRYDDYAQSANTIFNFMKKSEYLKEILYLIFDYPYKHYTFKYFEV